MNLLYNCFIVNPAAGGGKNKEELIEKIRAACEKQGDEYEIHVTKEAGDAEKFVRRECVEKSGKKIRFYACGGEQFHSLVVETAFGLYGNT